MNNSGDPKAALLTPCLCLDIEMLEANIQKMEAFLGQGPVKLRPHSKTHKCPTIAWMQLRAGAIGITCAKLSEAEVMAQAGIRDILIANQIIDRVKIARLANLAAYTDVMVAVDTLENARDLAQAAQQTQATIRVLIEVEVGMGRCGVIPGEPALALARELSRLPGLHLEGLMGYEGHAVMIPDRLERIRAAHTAMSILVGTRDLLVANGIPVAIVSGGGSGTFDITGVFPGMTEIQAGSYATMDAKYRSVGLNFGCALSVLAKVIARRDDDVAIIDAGMKAMTSEFGMPVVIQPRGWELERLAEEHGFLRRVGGSSLAVGDMVELIPSHGCTTINLHDRYYVLRQGRLEAIWPIAARGCVQ
ncbi:MAG: DSD1 family PLP-dependent enzyme [Chloroflexi bacterium]|nr:DSD1 family PLP-dependent enzyme [Chloroflexota bacterium]